ncbi:MAG: formyltetrahydrofolate deformylase [Micavibrio sp.]
MHVLRLHCVDRPGIVAAVATALAQNQCNIHESSQFHDPLTGRFFMRIAFHADEGGAAEKFSAAFQTTAQNFSMEWEIHDLARKVPALIMVSKADHCLHDLLYRTRTGALNIDIKGIASNHPDLEPLARHENIPYHHLSMEDGKAAQEGRLAALIDGSGAELILLARYMQVLSNSLCLRYAGRIINIHHSFLPGFKGARPYHQAYERGVKIIGATAHFATEDLDEGPIIAQDIAHVDHACLPERMQQMGRDIEAIVLARAARLYTERRIFAHGNKTVIL